MELLYSIGEWTWVFCNNPLGKLIWGVWLMINLLIFAILMFSPFYTSEDSKWRPDIALLLQALIFFFVLYIGGLFY